MSSVTEKVRRPARGGSRRLSRTEQAGSIERLRRYVADTLWAEGHREELLRRYPEQWVAVFDKRVIGHDADPAALLSRLPDPAYTYQMFLTKDPWDAIL